MKKLILIALCSIFTMLSLTAQPPVTTFLGIPVDGSKSEMIRKLKEKGFTYSSRNDCLSGQFNGKDVDVYLLTNNGKIWRIAVHDANYTDETNIKINFNRLCNQFKNNSKYKSYNDEDFTIPDDEDISYEILVHNKRYEADFYQRNPQDASIINETITNRLKESFGEKYQEMLDNDSTFSFFKQNISPLINIEEYSILSKRSVWFMIADKYGKYGIIMFYDNEYNHANGEDL